MKSKSKELLIFLFSFVYPLFLTGQQVNQLPAIPSTFCISQVEMKLFNLINEYRKEFKLPPIPLSMSLCFVASTHVKDLYANHPDKGSCNFHSWSNKGFWKPFCYPSDENKKNSVWDKPKEICNYPGKGYEIVYWENNPVTLDSIIPFWSSIEYFNSFLMNTGKWQGKKWNAIGISVYQNYAAAWFGELPDPEGIPYVCGNPPEKKVEVPIPPLEASKKMEALKQTESDKKPASTIDTLVNKSGKSKKPVKPLVKPVDTTRASIVPVVSHLVVHKYYIIVNSQLTIAEAKKVAERLIKEGYTETKILKKDTKNRISIYEFDNKVEADSVLHVVRKIFNDAWILK
ncbi:MAG: SPOR domain-containing protein [Bacteroidetes bacterium]|nr:SPOR domain-containing protein [Bacteroidota bacterium]